MCQNSAQEVDYCFLDALFQGSNYNIKWILYLTKSDLYHNASSDDLFAASVVVSHFIILGLLYHS